MTNVPPPPPGATVPVTVGGKEPGAGSLVLNLLWFFLSGIWLFFSYLTSGIVMCITIIGIPLGLGNFSSSRSRCSPSARPSCETAPPSPARCTSASDPHH